MCWLCVAESAYSMCAAFKFKFEIFVSVVFRVPASSIGWKWNEWYPFVWLVVGTVSQVVEAIDSPIQLCMAQPRKSRCTETTTTTTTTATATVPKQVSSASAGWRHTNDTERNKTLCTTDSKNVIVSHPSAWMLNTEWNECCMCAHLARPILKF